MNISNKILLGFFGTAFVYMTAVFVEIRLTGEDEDLTDDNVMIETAPMSDVNYVIVADLGRRLYIKSSDEPRLEIRSRSGDFLSKLTYEIKDDTLVISELKFEEEVHFDMTLFLPNKFSGIETKDAFIHLSQIDLSSLSINQVGGRIILNGDIKLGKLNIVGSQSAEFDVFDSDIDTVALDIDDSNVELRAYVGRIEGSMKNDSYLYVENTDDINFKKDESSHIRL